MTQAQLECKVADLETAFNTLLGGLGKFGRVAAKGSVTPLDTRDPKVDQMDLTGRVADLSQQLIDAQSQIAGLNEWKKRTEQFLSELREHVPVDSMGGAPAKGASVERDGDLTSAIKNAHANGQRGGRGLGHPVRS